MVTLVLSGVGMRTVFMPKFDTNKSDDYIRTYFWQSKQ